MPPRFIQLTKPDGDPISINLNLLESFYKTSGKTWTGTVIVTSGLIDNLVKESYEEVKAIINKLI